MTGLTTALPTVPHPGRRRGAPTRVPRPDAGELGGLADSVAAVLRRHADGPIAVEQTEAAADIWATAADLGWTGIGLAEERGGSEGGLDELVALLRVVGRWAAPGPFLGTAAAAAVLDAAGDATAQGGPAGDVDPDRAAALLTAGVALALPLRPAPAGAVCATGTAGPGCAARWQLLQPLPGTTHALLLGRGEVAVAALAGPLDTPADGPFDPAVGVVEVGADALGTPVAQLPADAVRGRIGLLVAAQALGIADRMTETAVEDACQRVQFGRPIGSFQAVKHRCADMAIRQRAALGAVTYALTKAWHADPEAGLAAALANAEACLETHGAIGHTWEFAGHRFLKRAHVLRGIAAVLERGRPEVSA